MNLDLIKWDTDLEQAKKQYYGFQIYTLESLNINFYEFKYDALELSKKSLNERIDPKELEEHVNYYWDCFDRKLTVMGQHNKDFLKIRFGIFLLTDKMKDFEDLNETFYWFLEFLEQYGFSKFELKQIIESYFKFSGNCV